MHPNPTTEAGLTPGQVAAKLGVDVLTVRRWMRHEDCPVVTVGRARRIPRQWVAEQAALLAGSAK